jgi:hypothetical protein
MNNYDALNYLGFYFFTADKKKRVAENYGAVNIFVFEVKDLIESREAGGTLGKR